MDQKQFAWSFATTGERLSKSRCLHLNHTIASTIFSFIFTLSAFFRVQFRFQSFRIVKIIAYRILLRNANRQACPNPFTRTIDAWNNRSLFANKPNGEIHSLISQWNDILYVIKGRSIILHKIRNLQNQDLVNWDRVCRDQSTFQNHFSTDCKEFPLSFLEFFSPSFFLFRCSIQCLHNLT